MHTLKPKIRLLRALMGTAVCALAMIATTNVASAGEAPSGEIETGNKPSTFNYRFNPYIRHNSFENDAEVTDMSVFAMVPVKWFGKDGAFVYEGPMSRDQDFSDIGAGETTGFADGVIRGPFILKPFKLGKFTWTPVIIPEITLPIGSDDLTEDTLIFSPGGGFVISSNPRWFVALVQFYDTDISKSSGRPDIDRFRMRWFLQYMISPKNRFYVMAEFQGVFDNESDEDSFWFAPEFGKVIVPPKGDKAGFVVYAKPGFGINNQSNSFEREWSLELGVRWMWNKFPMR